MDGSGSVEFPEFCVMMVKKMRESDIENEVQYFYTISHLKQVSFYFEKSETNIILMDTRFGNILQTKT